ncbi:MAG TPA: M48 family metallopeptidase [Rhodanobacteraceae bacterium]|nr:M48 family metallopeptidase [Rhodanobacteraceae bacterium]
MNIATRIAAVAALLVLAACATSPTGRSQLILVSPSDMSELGVAAFDKMGKEGKFANAPREQAYARCVADALISVLPAPWNKQQWEVRIIDDDTANAFALPGGRIGVNQGMFKVATNQAQLATVLSHELAHVVAHHAAERFSDKLAVQAGVAALTAYGASKGADADRTMALLGLGAEVGVTLPFSRAQENEADVLGQRIMAEAGFDPREAPALWKKMEASGGSSLPAFLSTHPASGDRMQTLARQAQTLMPVYTKARASGHTPHCG